MNNAGDQSVRQQIIMIRRVFKSSVVIALIAILAWLFDLGDPFKDQISFYAGSCVVDRQPNISENRCFLQIEIPTSFSWSDTFQFKVIANENVVLEKAPFGRVFRHENCAIWDRKNWQCSSKLRVSNGYLLHPKTVYADPFRYIIVSKFRWFFESLKSEFE